MRNNKTDIDQRASSLLEAAVRESRKPDDKDQKIASLEREMSMVKYAISNLLKIVADLPNIREQVEQLDYRTLATIRAIERSDVNFADKVEQEAYNARSDAFTELSDKDDEQKSLIPCDINTDITEEHHIIFTTECKDVPDKSIFRSKVELKSEEFKEYKDYFIGKKVGDEFPIDILGNQHTATILGARIKDADK